MRLRASIFALTFGLGAFGVEAEPTATLTLTEARQIAQAALLNGDAALTRQLALGLIHANPDDAHALLMLSAAEGALENPAAARRAASKAYRASESKQQRLQAAKLASQFALAEERPTLSQVWLRRAATQSETPEEDKTLARAYGRVRATNPLAVNLAFSVRPSNNVNNGADSAVQAIDGVPVVGFLSRDAQALSGTILGADLQLRYRLRADNRSRTSLGGRLYVQRVLLSDEAENLENSDFDASYGEVSLEHAFAVGETPGNSAKLRLTRGTYWSQDDTDYHLLRFDADRTWRINEKTFFTLGGSVAQYTRPGAETQDSDTYLVRARVSHTLDGGDVIGASLSYQEATSDSVNRRSETVSARLSYAFAKSWGPAQARASLSLSHADYPEYTSLLNTMGQIGVIPGGRQDTSAYADLSLFFADYDYAGFAPTVTFRAGRKSSNVSRFDTREFSVNFGFQSKF